MVLRPSIAAILSGTLAILENGEWKPGIGDPTIQGWTITILYFVAVALCVWAALRAYFRHRRGAGGLNHVYFWAGLGLLLLLLGINKQLDLQTWLWWTGRRLAHEEGWYDARRWVQGFFILCITTGGAAMVTGFAWLSRGAAHHHKLALAGAVFVAGFVIIRAASFHHVDALLDIDLGAIDLNALLELPGIVCVILSAAYSLLFGVKEREKPLAPPEPPRTAAFAAEWDTVRQRDWPRKD